ncbi:hypothetical protein H2684_06835 [Clostridium sp. cel8]|jgi:Na+/phosphate symporter|uniref:hypothetical protein n=1 Tax=unclassified Clostridium TaxID=2614128 RepID=UPI0015F3E1F3|nr:hypothetical protein [Clostridium sp. cel8]MBA5851020.1 hypothetical protein [Clostridium sp. cel8]
MEKIKSIITELIVIVVAFSIVFLADLVDIQTKDSYLESTDVETMEIKLKQHERELYELGNNIIEIKNNMEVLKKNIYKSKNNKDKYNKMVIEYNREVRKYNKYMKIYNKKIDESFKENHKYESKSIIINWIEEVLGIDLVVV